MTTLLCVEPAKENAAPGARRVVMGGPGDTVVFPGVDSCLAIIAILSNGVIVGGHVGQQWGEGQAIAPAVNAKRIAGEMLVRMGRHLTRPSTRVDDLVMCYVKGMGASYKDSFPYIKHIMQAGMLREVEVDRTFDLGCLFVKGLGWRLDFKKGIRFNPPVYVRYLTYPVHNIYLMTAGEWDAVHAMNYD